MLIDHHLRRGGGRRFITCYYKTFRAFAKLVKARREFSSVEVSTT